MCTCNHAIMQRFAHALDVRKSRHGTAVYDKHDVGRGVVMGWGAGSFSSSAKGRVATPTTRLQKLFVRYTKCRGIVTRVVPIDETRTTMCCSKCGHELGKLVDAKTNREIRGLKSCAHCGSQADPVLLNRDANAAINILACTLAILAGKERPEYLRRAAAGIKKLRKQRVKKTMTVCTPPHECVNTPTKD